MLTWSTYYYETTRREDEIARAIQDRYLNSVTEACQSGITRLGIQMLDRLGTKLVQWGQQLQCRCAELTMSQSKRAV